MMIKTKREIRILKNSAAVADACIPVIEDALKESITEKEIARRIRKQLRAKGAHEAFRIIVACGNRSSRIHPKPCATNKIVSGIGYVDFGACYLGYRTDVTVPFIKGKIRREEKKIVNITLQAYRLAIKSVKLGMPCWKVHEKVDSFLERRGFKLRHAIGHGIGRRVHEPPCIGMPRMHKKKRRWEKLKRIKFRPGMVFTIEPGVYVHGIGGCRIENVFLLGEHGLKQLTHAKLITV